MAMLCPKCTNPMTQYERNGVTVDQCTECTECKGIFLDRGELEQLVAAEGAWRQQAYPDEDYDRPRYHDDDDEHAYRPRYYDRGDEHAYRRYDKKRRRRSFLEGLFDD
jgi:Zn-finger nucleic acid-binding protein